MKPRRTVDELLKDLDPDCEYEHFDVMEKLTKAHWYSDVENGRILFSKLMLTGDCEFHDYGTGYHFIKIRIVPCRKQEFLGKYQVRIWYATIDDGDYGGWGEPVDLGQAEEMLKHVAEIYDGLDKLPREETMNMLLKPFNIKVCYE